MKNSGIYFTFTGCYSNQNSRQNTLKIEKLPFLAKFEAFGDRFFYKLDISTSKYQINLLIYMYCVP